METNKIFIWMARITSVLGLLVVLIILGVMLFSWDWRMPKSAQQKPQHGEQWYLDIEQELHTENKQILALKSKDEKSFYSRYGSAHYAKNLLFVGSDATQTYWLFKSHQQQFTYDVLKLTDENKNEMPYLIYYEVIKADTNQDGELSYYDSVMLAVSNLDGTDYTELMPKNGEILKIYRHPQEQCLYIIQKDDVQLTKTCFDLQNFSKKKEFSIKLE